MFNLEDGTSFRLDIETGQNVSIELRSDVPRIPSAVTFPTNPYNLGGCHGMDHNYPRGVHHGRSYQVNSKFMGSAKMMALCPQLH